MFLTPDEIADLTGYRQASKQITMLHKQGVPFHVNAAGHPRVARAVIEGRYKPSIPEKDKTWTPSWAVNRQ